MTARKLVQCAQPSRSKVACKIAINAMARAHQVLKLAKGVATLLEEVRYSPPPALAITTI